MYSEGEIESCSNYLLDLTCSTTNGMSGAPVVANYVTIGIYLGGPPLPGQRLLFLFLKMLNENKILEVYTKRNEMLAYDSYYTLNLFLPLVQEIEDCYNS